MPLQPCCSRAVGNCLSVLACSLPALPVEVSIWVIKWEVHICANKSSQRNKKLRGTSCPRRYLASGSHLFFSPRPWLLGKGLEPNCKLLLLSSAGCFKEPNDPGRWGCLRALFQGWCRAGIYTVEARYLAFTHDFPPSVRPFLDQVFKLKAFL